MELVDLMKKIAGAGIDLEVGANGQGFTAHSDRPLTDQQRAYLRRHKDVLLSQLRQVEPQASPPPLTEGDREAVTESIDERAAIMEYDGGLSRADAEQEARAAMRVYQVRVAMPDNRPPRWCTMLAPGCDHPAAIDAANGQFGTTRVLDVIEHKFTLRS